MKKERETPETIMKIWSEFGTHIKTRVMKSEIRKEMDDSLLLVGL